MSVALTSADFGRVVVMLAGLPEFRTVQGRVVFITDVFAGTPRRHDVVSRLDLDGEPRTVAVRVVDRLQTFGQDEPGRETLGVLINKMLSYLGGGAEASELRSMLSRYPFTTKPTADTRAIPIWRGRESPAEVQEKIIGENTLRHLYLLELALDAARAVVRIATRTALGSGFMVSDDLLMTNNHVLPDATNAADSEFAFNYQLDRRGLEMPVCTRRARPGGVFYTSSVLDVSIVELDIPAGEVGNSDFRPLPLRAERVQRDERVAIIQHPGGHYKKISMQNNFVAYADNTVIQYTTSTEPGSSGSPVFNTAFEVIGIHHSGGLLTEPGSEQRYLCNAGTSTIAILEDLARHAPAVTARLAERR